MSTMIFTNAHSRDRVVLWGGRILSGLVVLFLLMDVVIKLLVLPKMPEASEQLGWSAHMAIPLGVILLICTVLYAIPRTSILGAILLTGYLGGAVATHTRIDSPLFTHILFGIYLGVAVWGGLFMRNPAIRALVPWQR